MVRRVVLHIGVHKTGTSAIQSFLHRNAYSLRRQDFFYQPSVKEWPDNNALAHAFDNSRDPTAGIRHLRELMEQSRDRTLILSSEMLIEHQVDSGRLLDVLDGWDKTATAYLRHPCDILIAAFGERVKHYPSQYMRSINDKPLAYDPGQYDLLAPWLQYKDVRLILAPYDARQWAGGYLFADVLSMIGASYRGLDIEDIRANVSVSFASSERLRQAMVAGATAAEHKVLRELLTRRDDDGSRYPLDLATIRYCFERMGECIPAFRPHMRVGFDIGYLFAARWRG